MANVVCPAGLDGRRRFGDTTGALGGTLTYASGMADYAVRQLTSSYAPQIGGETMASVLPDEWLAGPGTSTPMQAIGAWCGGIGIGSQRRLFLDTGGHADSACNAIWDYDFRDVNGRPVGFRLLPNSLSTVANTPNTTGTHAFYTDGKPGAVHSYGGWFAIDDDTIARSCGALWKSGNSSNDTFRWDITTGARVQMADQTASTGSGRYMFAIKKPGQPYALMFQTSGNVYERLDCDAASGVGTWNGSFLTAGGSGVGQYPMVVWDSSRDRVITFNLTGSGGVQAFTVNWAAGTLTYVGTATMTGDTAIFADSGLSAFYDEAADKFWIFGGSTAGGAAGYSNIYEIDASAFDSLGGVAVTAHALSATLSQTGSSGTWTRFCWMPQDRLIGFVHNGTAAPSVIKLPAAT